MGLSGLVSYEYTRPFRDNYPLVGWMVTGAKSNSAGDYAPIVNFAPALQMPRTSGPKFSVFLESATKPLRRWSLQA
jgi:hypothetical protein